MKVVKLQVTEEDISRIFLLLSQTFAVEHSMGRLSAADHNAEKSFKWLVVNAQCAAWIVEDDEGNVLGTIGLHRTTPWYSDAEYFADGWFYVLPQYRKTGVGKLLLDTAMEFAKQHDLPLIVGVFSMGNPEQKIEIMNKMGLKLVGGLFATGV